MAYHSQTLCDGFHRYPTYENELHSIVEACKQWKNDILRKEIAIHISCRPLPTLDNPWELVSLDYVSCFPSTKNGNGCVFIVVDCFLRMGILAHCKKILTTILIFSEPCTCMLLKTTCTQQETGKAMKLFWQTQYSHLNLYIIIMEVQEDAQRKVLQHCIL